MAAIPHGPRAAPAAPTPPAQSFAALCKDGAVVDSRPDPAWVLASYDGDNCRAPRLPAVIDGRSAKREQIAAAMTAVKTYAAQSQAFEQCIAVAVAWRKSPGRSFQLVEAHRILVSQKNRRLAAARMAAAIDAFNAFGSECAE